MKRALILLTMFLMLLAYFPVDNANSFLSTIEIPLYFEKPSLEKVKLYGKNFTRVEIKGCKLHMKEGEPCIPVKPLRILLPFKTEVKKIDVISSKRVKVAEFKNIELGPKMYILGESPNQDPPSPSYDGSKLYPGKIYCNLGIQYFRGFPILHINVQPVQYLGETGELFYYPKIVIKIELKRAKANLLYRGFAEDKEALLRKVDDVGSPSLQEIIRSYPTSESEPIFDYLIITTEEFKNYTGKYSLYDLKRERESQGLKVAIETVENIYEKFEGRDEQEKIRNFIKYAYKNWGISWVLLVGDHELVPTRALAEIDGDDMVIPSDMYYQCLDGSYDYDNDSIFGEKHDGVNGGRIDLYAEVYIGRASADCIEQLKNFVRKTISYERSKWEIDDYLKRVDSVGQHLWSGAGGWGFGYAERCIGNCSDYNQVTHGINPTIYKIRRRYEINQSWTKKDIINDIMEGLNFINHIGHANPNYCMKLSVKDIENLKNDRYGFWYSQGCHAGQFTVDECIAEAWTLSKGGGFAAIMNSGYGYGSGRDYDGPDNRFAREFWDALNFSEERISRLGVANQDSKEDNFWRIDDGYAMYHNCYSKNLLGDPYVQIKGMEDFRADFTWSPYFAKPNSSIHFYDKSKGAERWHWDFGDGTTSEERNPVHVYKEEGVYLVNLTIYGFEGTTYCLKRVEVWKNWAPNAVIVPSFLATDIPTITFDGGNSWDIDGRIVSYFWEFGDGSTSREEKPTHTYQKDGIYYVNLTVTDDGGKEGKATAEIRIDMHTPPETEVVIAGLYGENDWLLSSAYLSIDATDWSGVKFSMFRVDGGKWQKYTDPVEVKTNGYHVIEFYSEDVWGNREDIKERVFKIDMELPYLLVKLSGERRDNWFTSPVEVLCLAKDNVSGVNVTMYRIDGGVWKIYEDSFVIKEEGRHVLEVYTKDFAGNRKSWKGNIFIDTEPPFTTYSISGDFSKGGKARIELLAKDNGTGVACTYYSIDGGDWNVYSSPFFVAGDGYHRIEFYSVDHFGHKEKVRCVEFYIGENPEVNIAKPEKAIYLYGNKLLPAPVTIIIGPIEVKCSYQPSYMAPEKVEFYVNGKICYVDYEEPFSWMWSERCFGFKELKVIAYYIGYTSVDKIGVFKLS